MAKGSLYITIQNTIKNSFMYYVSIYQLLVVSRYKHRQVF